MVIAWTEDYKIGLPAIDAEHRLLLDLVNRFLVQAAGRAAALEMAATLDQLLHETRAHFQREEGALDRVNYPYLAAHAAEHERLLGRIRYFLEQVRTTGLAADKAAEADRFLRSWLLDHICGEDKAYRPYLMTFS